MRHLPVFLKKAVLYSITLVLAFGYPLAAVAEEPAPTTTTQPAATTTTPALTSPEATPPAPQPAPPNKAYTYDEATKRWNTKDWQYDAASGTYKPTPPPAPVIIAPVPPTLTAAQAPPAPTASNQTAAKSDSSSQLDSSTTTSIANALNSLAGSGNADVLKNTLGGNATSGNATSAATIINNINSTLTSNANKEAATFVSNVMGDVNGDIMLQPMLLKAMLEANVSQEDSSVLNSTNNTSITNDIDLTAKSGDATVAGNTKAGNAASGSANTVADVVNIVNSMVAANQSFMGTINIYGNLNGDILIAPDFIPQLIASNKDAQDTSTSTVVSSKDTQTIVNNVALAAESGQALVSGNTSAGSATTGSADTNLVIFNLSGHEIVASNSLLVFVNVLGKWVGLIVDAPTGATAAAIGNGVSTNNKIAPNLVIDAVNETQITNNLTLNSQSGNALVSHNTSAGNATSGNATASANIANISNSSLGLTGWFGVLFINVFGSWNGSFGVDTAAGDPLQTRQGSSRTVHSKNQPLRVIQFIPRESAQQVQASTTLISPGDGSKNASTASALSNTTGQNAYEVVKSDIPTQESIIRARQVNLPLTIGSIVLVGVSLYVLRRFLF